MTHPAYSARPLSFRQRNAIQMAVCWRADVGPLLDVYWRLVSVAKLSVASPSCKFLRSRFPAT